MIFSSKIVKGPAPKALPWQDLYSKVSTQVLWTRMSLKKALGQGDRNLYPGIRDEIVLIQK